MGRYRGYSEPIEVMIDILDELRAIKELMKPKIVDEWTELKRPELMKRMSQIDAPQGWNRWDNDKMRAYLKEGNYANE